MRLGHGPRRTVVILWAWTALLSGLVLRPDLHRTRATTCSCPSGSLALGARSSTPCFVPGRRERPAEAELEPASSTTRTPTGRAAELGDVVDLESRRRGAGLTPASTPEFRAASGLTSPAARRVDCEYIHKRVPARKRRDRRVRWGKIGRWNSASNAAKQSPAGGFNDGLSQAFELVAAPRRSSPSSAAASTRRSAPGPLFLAGLRPLRRSSARSSPCTTGTRPQWREEEAGKPWNRRQLVAASGTPSPTRAGSPITCSARAARRAGVILVVRPAPRRRRRRQRRHRPRARRRSTSSSRPRLISWAAAAVARRCCMAAVLGGFIVRLVRARSLIVLGLEHARRSSIFPCSCSRSLVTHLGLLIWETRYVEPHARRSRPKPGVERARVQGQGVSVTAVLGAFDFPPDRRLIDWPDIVFEDTPFAVNKTCLLVMVVDRR